MAFAEAADPGPGIDMVASVADDHAARIVRRAHGFRFVHLRAPTGFGKTEIATRIAHAAGRPMAWCSVRPDTSEPALRVGVCRALLAAWPDAPNEPHDVTDENASRLLDRCLDVIGEATLVLDDIDHVDADTLDRLIEHIAAFDSLHVITTSQLGPTPGLTVLDAAGRLARIDRTELTFRERDCIAMVGDERTGRDLHEATGGWPVAVLVGARSASRAGDSTRDDSLLQLLLRSDPSVERPRLAVAALVDRLPPTVVEWLRPTADRRAAAAIDQLIVQPAEVGWTIRGWVRDALLDEPLDAAVVDEMLNLLTEAGDEESRLTLAVQVGRLREVIDDVDHFCAAELVAGGHGRVRRLIDRIAPEQRSPELQVSAVLAEQASSRRRPQESELRDLVRRTRDSDGRPSPRASSALANHLRMVGDAGVIEVCTEVVGPLIELAPDEAAALARARWADLPERLAAAELLRFLGQGTMLSAGPGSFAEGRRMIESALRIADDEHLARSHQGWVLYIEALLLVTAPSQVVFRARTIALELWRARHSDAPLRLSELAILEFFSGHLDRARSTIESAREAAAEIGNDLATIPLAGLECALDVIDDPESPELVDAFDRTIFHLLDHDYLAVFHQVFAAEFGILQLRLGNPAVAARFCAVAEASPDSFMSSSFSLRRRRLQALLRLHDEPDEGRVALRQLRDLAVELSRAALVDLIDEDLEGAVSTPGPDVVSESEALVITALAPAFSVHRDGVELPAPSGYTAKLLALLVASSGVVTVDVALEALWPGADPAVSRNRLHGVLLRLRRALGFGPDGPVTCRDELIRLQAGADLVCDAWDFEAKVAAGEPVGDVGELLSEQFRYDDRVAAYREHLRVLAAPAAD